VRARPRRGPSTLYAARLWNEQRMWRFIAKPDSSKIALFAIHEIQNIHFVQLSCLLRHSHRARVARESRKPPANHRRPRGAASPQSRRAAMVRGNAKALAQAKNLAKKDAAKTAKSDLKLRGAALKATCPICKANMINHHQLKAHYESKHPKETCPPPPEE
jgi:hypothetical protein